MEIELLTKQQHQILKYIYLHTSRKNSGSSICRGIFANYSNISQNLSKLYCSGLIYEEKKDGRSKRWYLTDKGREVIKIYLKMEVLLNGK